MWYLQGKFKNQRNLQKEEYSMEKFVIYERKWKSLETDY